MKFLHIADLHFGKIVHGINMINDQKEWVDRFIELVSREKPDAVLIAGDVYDRTQPSDEAVDLLDRFITELALMNVPVMIAAGNHDSASKLSFGYRVMGRQGIHISGNLQKELIRITLEDEFGPVDFTLLPYMFPAAARMVLGDSSITDYTDAVRRVLEVQNIDPDRRNVLVAHQNVIGTSGQAEYSGSETAVGGIGGVDYTAFEGFDYVALGHIHAAAEVGRPSIRYAGTPLCYHFNETRQGAKGALMVQIDGNGTVTTKLLPIEPLHIMREVRGAFNDVLESELKAPEDCYVGIVITDRKLVPEDYDRLKTVVEAHRSKLLSCRDEYSAAGTGAGSAADGGVRVLTPAELFEKFYMEKTERLPEEKDRELLEMIGETVRNSSDWKNDESPSESAVRQVLLFLAEQEENV